MKPYEELILEVIPFEAEDIIRTSGTNKDADEDRIIPHLFDM